VAWRGFGVAAMMALSDWSGWSGALALWTVAAMTAPVQAEPRAVVELFTSQGCSSCPPADKVIGELADDPSVIALTMPIDYWDYLGWKDTLADARFSARQKAYSAMRGDRDVYTPQAIVNGAVHVNGSDRGGIDGAIGDTRKTMSVPVSMTQSGNQLKVTIAAAGPNAAAKHGEVWICAISKSVPILIGRGENRGREVIYHNVVRNWLKVGDWTGAGGDWTVPLENLSRDGVDAAAVYVQDGSRDKPGPMLGAAFTSLQ
jgi:hypothetical protein